MLTKLRDFWNISNQTHMVRGCALHAAAAAAAAGGAVAAVPPANPQHPHASIPPALVPCTPTAADHHAGGAQRCGCAGGAQRRHAHAARPHGGGGRHRAGPLNRVSALSGFSTAPAAWPAAHSPAHCAAASSLLSSGREGPLAGWLLPTPTAAVGSVAQQHLLPAQRCWPPWQGPACRPGGAYGHAPYGHAPYAAQQQHPSMPPPPARARAPVQPSPDFSPDASNSGDSDFSIDSELTRKRLRSGSKKGGGGASKRSGGGGGRKAGGGGTPRSKPRDRACVSAAGSAGQGSRLTPAAASLRRPRPLARPPVLAARSWALSRRAC